MATPRLHILFADDVRENMSDKRLVLALDFGGSKLAAALVEVGSGEIHNCRRYATPALLGAEASLKAMIQAGWNALNKSDISAKSLLGIGISFGGPVSADRQWVQRSSHVSD